MKRPDGREVRLLWWRVRRGMKRGMDEMIWEIKRIERSETGEDIRREEGKMIGTKI